MTEPIQQRRTMVIGAILAACIGIGLLAGVVVTLALGTVRGGEVADSSSAPTPSAFPSVVATARSSAAPSASLTAEPTASPSAQPSTAPSADDIYSGCFFEGGEPPRTQEEEPVVAPGLLAKLPEVIDGHPVQLYDDPVLRGAYVGSSIQAGVAGVVVQGFASCTGADPARIRYGFVRGPNSLGYDLMAVEVDGFSGAELANVLLSGTVPADDRALLRTVGYHGWMLRTEGQWFVVTSSRETVYWIKWFCCVDPMGGDEDLPTFDEIVHGYLDAINDRPADW